MRIALVSEHANPMAALGRTDAGGQNVHVACLATALSHLGHDVTVYTRRDARDTPTTTRMGTVRVEQVAAGPPRPVPKDDLLVHMQRFAELLADRWARRPPDIVHAHFWMSGMAALAATEGTGIPVVQTYHALGTVKRRYQGCADTSPPERIQTEREIGTTCAQIIATCSDELFELVRLGVDRRHIRVIPCGVDLQRFNPLGPVAPRTPRHRILAVGRLVPRKGFDTLIKALPPLPEVELVIAGGPAPGELAADAEADRLQRLAGACGVADRVALLGGVARDTMPALMRSADIVACTPWYEPFGIVPLEAMASGVPVVASAVGGLTDSVLDGSTGVLVPPRDESALADALQGLLADDEYRRRLGAAGLRRARERYSWDRVALKTAEVYGHLLAAGASPLAEMGKQ